jgi:hypothetical protein
MSSAIDRLASLKLPKLSAISIPGWKSTRFKHPEQALPSCFAIMDIFELILQLLANDWLSMSAEDPVFFVGPHALSALARTCKAFQEPALDHLWRNQLLGFPTILATLPHFELVFSSTSRYRFVRISLIPNVCACLRSALESQTSHDQADQTSTHRTHALVY